MFNNRSDIKTIKALKKALKEKDKIIRRYEIMYGGVEVSDEEQMIVKLIKLKEEYEGLIKEIKEQQNLYKELNEERVLINSEIKKIVEETDKINKERR